MGQTKVGLIAPIFPRADEDVPGLLAVGTQDHHQLGIEHWQEDEHQAKDNEDPGNNCGLKQAIFSILSDESLPRRAKVTA